MTGATLDFGAVADALRALVAEHGGALLGDRRRTLALLLDHVPDRRREIRALATGLDGGVAVDLLAADRALAGVIVDRQVNLLEQESGLRGDIARGIVGTLAFALGVAPRPGAVADVPPLPPPAPVARDAPVTVPFAVSLTPASPRSPAAIPVGLRVGMVAGAAAVALAIVAAPGLMRGAPHPASVAASTGYADEAADFGVTPQADLRDEVASPTPLAIPVGRRVLTGELRAMLTAAAPPLLLDVLAGGHDRTIAGARYLATAGATGTFDDAEQQRVGRTLARLTGNDRARAIVVFCGGAQCWESYNAVLRAGHAGYRSLFWYRGGLAAWSAAGLPMADTPAPEASD